MVLFWIWSYQSVSPLYGCVSYSGCIYTYRKLVLSFLFKENWTEENDILLKKTPGPGWPQDEMDCGAHTKILVCDDYTSFCCPVVWFVYIYTYIFFCTTQMIAF